MVIYNVYHGSPHLFARFHEGNIFFTDEFDIATYFGQNIYECNISMDDPLIIDLHGQSWGSIMTLDSIYNEILRYSIISSGGDPDDPDNVETIYFLEYGTTIDFVGSWAQKHGYDGVIAYNVYEDDARYIGTQYIVYHPDNVDIVNNENVEQKFCNKENVFAV